MKRTRLGRMFSVMALVLVAVMMLCLVGCGDSSKDADKDAGNKTVSTTATTTTTAEDAATTTTGDVDATTTGTEDAPTDGTTGADTTDTTGGDPFATNTTSATKKPVTTTTTSNTIPTGEGSVFDEVPSKLSGTKIRMLIWWELMTNDKQEAEFFKEQTGIQVTYETATMEKYQTTLSGKIMAGSPPQVAVILSEWYPQPITRKLMQPIKVTGWDYSNKEDDIYALSLMEQFSYKGDLYGVMLKGSTSPVFEVMFYNKDIMKAKGVKDDPYALWKKGQWNWDTCLSIAKACTDAKKEEYGMTTIYFNYWMLSAGEDFVMSDIHGLRNNVKSSRLLAAWQYAWDLVYTHKVIPTMFVDQWQLFYHEKVAMMATGSYMMQSDPIHTNYVPQNCDFNWGVVPFPSPAGQSSIVASEAHVWGFPAKVEGNKLQAAMWWLRYHLDDYKYSSRDFFGSSECWEVIEWVYNQKIQSFNSVGILTYGGKYTAATIQYDLIDMATTKAAVKTNLDRWYAELDTNIQSIESEM